MNKNRFLLLMTIGVIGLFSIANAGTATAAAEAQLKFSQAKMKASEAKIEGLANIKIADGAKAVVAEAVPAPSAPEPVKTKQPAPPAKPAPDPQPEPAPAPAPPAPVVAAVSDAPTVSRGMPRTGELINWFKGGNQAFPAGQKVTVIDVRTGKSFNAMRTYGHNHADTETLTNEDTLKMLEIWGGSWSWERRPVVVIVNGRSIAASCAGMPHAGLDNAPKESYVDNRSGGFGNGMNLDKIKNNGMDGHFDIHLLHSTTHSTNREDARHQANVQVAAGQ